MSRLILKLLLLALVFGLATPASAQRQMETLNRGLVAVRKNSTQIYVGWRLFGNDPANIAFNLYRSANGAPAVKINANPLTATTDFTDTPGNLSTTSYSYFIRPVLNGAEQANSESASLPANADQKQFFSLPLRQDTGPNGPYTVKFCWVGDFDGDGDYDFLVDRLSTLGENEQFLEAYKNDGTFLWRMSMGANSVNQYSYEPGSSAISIGDTDNVTVYDMDGDGRSEVLVRTANGVSVSNAAGTQVASITAGSNSTQFLSVIDGLSGTELARATMPNAWAVHGTLTNKAMIAYLDGKRPSVVMYGYNRADTEEFYRQFTALDYRNGALTQRWTLPQTFPGSEGHQIRIADVDNDGKDEICDIGHVIDDNGTQLFNTELTHGDRFHIADINPDRPGLETFAIQQFNPTSLATALYESGTGSMIKKWYSNSPVDVGRGIALDIAPAHKGYEMYSTQPGIFNAKGVKIYNNNLWAPEGLWWDGDLAREFMDGAGSGALSPTIDKFNATTGTKDRLWSLYNDWGSFSTTQAFGGRPAFWGDLLGDWREEIVLVQSDFTALRIYTTTIAATNRIYTLMHNPQYRCQTTTKGYVQASYVDYYLGYGMNSEVPPPPMVAADLVWSAGNTWSAGGATSWTGAAGSPSAFQQGNSVLFDVSGSNASAINLSGNLAPGAVSFQNPQGFVLNGPGSLTGNMVMSKAGAGTVTLNGNHTYTGVTTVWDGALRIDGQLSSSPVTVWGGIWGGALADGQSGGRLAGSGTISQAVSIGYRGAITPGAGMGSAGTLQLGSSLALADGSVLALDLSNDPSGASSANDQIAIAGNLSLTGNVAIVVNTLNGSLAPGTYTLLTYGGTFSGSLANLSIQLPEGTAHTLSVGTGAIRLVIPVTRAPAAITWTGGQGGNVWDLFNTPNWSRAGTPDSFVAGDTVTFSDTGSVNPAVNLTTALPVAGMVVDSNNDYNFSGAGAIAGPGGLTKSGSGTLTLGTTNTYTGPTTITGGTLAVANLGDAGSASSIGAAGAAASNLVLNGGTLALVGDQTSTNRSFSLGTSGGTISVPTSTSLQVSGSLSGVGSLAKTGSGTLILASASSYSGGTFISQGTVTLASDAANVSGLGSGLITLNGGTLSMTNNVDTSSWATSSWALHVPAGFSGRLNADGRCNLTGPLTGGGDFTFHTPFVRTGLIGNWSAFSGRIFVISDADGGDLRIENSAGYPNAAVDLGNNVYAYYNSTMGSNLTLSIGTLSGASSASLRGGPTSGRTLTWSVGARNEDSTYSGNTSNSTGTTAITKVGTGTLTLAGACSHTGVTTVSNGRLRITGTSTGSNFTVQNGATLGGTGTITGNVTIQSGGALEWNPTPLAIVGNLTFSGNAVIRPAAGSLPVAGTYPVATYTGTLTGTPVFSWEPPVGSNLVATFSTATSGQITLTLTQPPRGPGPIVWTAANGFNWDSATVNWTAGGVPTNFITGDTPTFSNVGLATSAINLVANVEPASVVIDSTQNYTFSGTGAITGTASLVKSGSGTLTVSSAHTFDGGTTINAGSIAISNASSLGTGTVTLDGGTWSMGSLAPLNPVIVESASSVSGGSSGGTHAIKNISGSGDLTINATSVFDLEGDISGYSGNLYLTGVGSVRFFSSSINGSSNAAFHLGTRSLTARSGSAFNIGALHGSAGSFLSMASNSTSANCTYTIGGRNEDSVFAGVIANGSSTKPISIIKTGSGNLTLAGINTYTGATSINAGRITVTGALGATATTVGASGTLAGSGSIAAAVTCNGTLAPGAPIGSLLLGAGLVMGATSTWEVDLGSSSDLVAITGNLTLDGTVNLNAAPGFGPGTYTIATYSGALTNNTLNIGSVPVGFNAAVNTSTAGQVRLVIVSSNLPPVITIAAAAAPSAGITESTVVSVSASDDGGEPNLIYTWSASGPGAVVFSPNGTNASKGATATFETPGNYVLSVTVADAPGLSVSSSVNVTVVAPLTYASWENSSFSPAQILAGQSSASADPDADGLTNLAEYALGSQPLAFTPQPAVNRDGNSISITFQRPANLSDVAYHAELSSSFQSWEQLTLEVINPGADPETVRATKTFVPSPPDRSFIRLRFVK